MEYVQLFRTTIVERMKGLDIAIADAKKNESPDFIPLRNRKSIQEIFLAQVDEFIGWVVDDDLEKILKNNA